MLLCDKYAKKGAESTVWPKVSLFFSQLGSQRSFGLTVHRGFFARHFLLFMFLVTTTTVLRRTIIKLLLCVRQQQGTTMASKMMMHWGVGRRVSSPPPTLFHALFSNRMGGIEDLCPIFAMLLCSHSSSSNVNGAIADADGNSWSKVSSCTMWLTLAH